MVFLRDNIRFNSLLDRAQHGLTAMFQPLIRLDTMDVVAHEGLARSTELLGNISTPEL